MRYIYRMGAVILVLSLLGGCSYPSISYRKIERNMVKVNFANGINKLEAPILAQNFILYRGMGDRLYTLKPIGQKQFVRWFKEGEEIEFAIPPQDTTGYDVEITWEVYFRDREGSFFWGRYPVMPFYVELDAQSGKVLSWGLKRDR